MLDLKRIRDDLPAVREAMAKRRASVDLDDLLKLEAERREVLGEVEVLKHERNVTSEKVASLKREKKDAGDEIGRMKEVSARIRELDAGLAELDEKISALLLTVPNVPHDSVPVGESEADNALVRTWGEKPSFDFEPKDHVAVGEELGILDFERGAKIAGARFTLYKGLGAAMERALISFMLDIHTREHGYLEVLPPFMANTRSFIGTGQLPKFEEDLFKVGERDLYLVPTAEVPVTNIHQDEILEAGDLPVRYAAFTPCFRKEAGAHGKDTRGLIRQHQFNKVELVKFVRPETSYDELEALLVNAEAILQRLGLHYRVVTLCTADLSFSAAKCYDLEVWLPGQGAYREISSCSNFEDFQARRAAIRYRPEKGAKTKFVHTLNGSGLAIGRTVVAILEACQRADGSVVIPEALRPYMNGVEVIKKE